MHNCIFPTNFQQTEIRRVKLDAFRVV